MMLTRKGDQSMQYAGMAECIARDECRADWDEMAASSQHAMGGRNVAAHPASKPAAVIPVAPAPDNAASR